MNYSIIVAIDEEWGIGKNNNLLHPISADLRRFKKLTTGHTVVMGHNTFNSLPHGALPNRRNIVLSKHKQLQCLGCEMAHSVAEVTALTQNEDEVFVIGGAQIYTLFLPKVSKIYLTQLYARLGADVQFPQIHWDEWDEVEKVDGFNDINETIPYSFINLVRK